MLQEDSQLSQQSTDRTFRPAPSDPSLLRPSSSAVRINAFWFTSLVFSLGDALFCIFVKEWVRAYMEWTDLLHPQDALGVRQYRFEGLEVWHLSVVLTILPLLLQVALILFFAGLVDFLFGLNAVIATVVTVFIGICLLASFITTLLPVWYRRCPFKTSISDVLLYLLTHLGRLSAIGTHACYRFASQLVVKLPGHAFSRWAKSRLDVHRKFLPPLSSQNISWKIVDKEEVHKQNRTMVYSAQTRAVYQLFERDANLTTRLKLLSCLRTHDTAEYNIVTSLPVLAASLGIKVESISTLSPEAIHHLSRDTPSELLNSVKEMLFSTAHKDLTAIFDAVNREGSGNKERQHFEIALDAIRIMLILRAEEMTLKINSQAEQSPSEVARLISTLASLNEPKDPALKMLYVGCLGSLDQVIHFNFTWSASGMYSSQF
jgi:hypothetical protein